MMTGQSRMLSLTVALLGSFVLLAQEPDASSVSAQAQPIGIEAFTIPRAETLVTPEYPAFQLLRGGEALVSISFMVDTEGKPFDPMIVDSTGDEAFHEAALLASRFVPAKLSGEPIVGVERDFAYDVPAEWGACSLQIIGDSGTDFLLMQD
jgi:TonB family protein